MSELDEARKQAAAAMEQAAEVLSSMAKEVEDEALLGGHPEWLASRLVSLFGALAEAEGGWMRAHVRQQMEDAPEPYSRRDEEPGRPYTRRRSTVPDHHR